MKKTSRIAAQSIGAIAVLGAVVIGLNWVRVATAAQESVKYRSGIAAIGYYHYGVVPGTIVYDLHGVEGEASAVSVLGGFFEFADAMKDRDFDEVLLAWRGDVRFRLPGGDFKEIGASVAWENPVYLLRTFPERLKTPEGTPAFDVWTGGALGVLNAQMEDAIRLAETWFMREAILASSY